MFPSERRISWWYELNHKHFDSQWDRAMSIFRQPPFKKIVETKVAMSMMVNTRSMSALHSLGLKQTAHICVVVSNEADWQMPHRKENTCLKTSRI